MGLRFGVGLGPLSVSTRIGRGGRGGGGSSGDDDEFWLIAVFIVVLVLGAIGVDFGGEWELDWKNIFNWWMNIFVWWIFLHILPSIALFVGLFALFNKLNKRLLAQHVFFGLIGPTIYLACFHKIPLAVNGRYLWDGSVRKVFFTAPAYHWLVAIGGAIILPTLLFLCRLQITNIELARVKSAATAAYMAELNLRKPELVTKHAAWLAKRDKKAALFVVAQSEKKSLQQLTKNRRDALEDALTRLNDVTDKVFSQSPEPRSVLTDGGYKFPESIEKALRDALADVSSCLSSCQGFLSRDQIGHHQSGLYNLRVELAERFGLYDL